MKTTVKLGFTALVMTLALSACGKGGKVEKPDNYNMITDLSESMEIHTERQKEYLEYDGDYSTIDPNLYPNGDQFISDPLSVKLEWEMKEEKEVEYYSVIFGQNKDLSDGYEVRGNSNGEIELINVFLGTNYFKIVAHLSDGTTDESNIKEFLVDSTCPRNLKIDGLTNCRDLGGRELEDGGVFKQGMIYRTSGNRYQNKAGSQNVVGRGIISDAGKEEMSNHLKVKTEININDSTAYNLSLPDTQVKNFYMDYGGSAAHHFSRNTESVRNYFETLADENNYPIFFHCRIGTDRTGLCGILTNGLVGVDLNDIYQDYLFSNFGNIEAKRYIGSKAGQDDILNYVNFINSMPGETFKNKVYNTLLSIGLSRETLDSVISNLVEGDLPEDNQTGQIVKLANEMTVEGTSVQSESDYRNNPKKYIVLDSASKKASFDFTIQKECTATVVAYLGNKEYVDTKKIANALNLEIDYDVVTIKDQTYKQACMGVCGSRMNYFPVILGNVELSAGDHTLELMGTSNVMNVGSICVFPN